MLWIVTWCDYGIGAILALSATGYLSLWWMLVTVPLAAAGGFLRGIQKAREKERTP
jgi:TRAP-type C4-dicarboxylate transport system permease small subunit